MLIRLRMDHITLPDRLAAEIEDETGAALDAVPAAWGVSPQARPGNHRRNRLDMTRFPAADHLVSWAGLAPVARQSGPRQRKPSKDQGDVYLKTYCAQAANGTGNTGTFLGERLRRLTRRLAGPGPGAPSGCPPGGAAGATGRIGARNFR